MNLFRKDNACSCLWILICDQWLMFTFSTGIVRTVLRAGPLLESEVFARSWVIFPREWNILRIECPVLHRRNAFHRNYQRTISEMKINRSRNLKFFTHIYKRKRFDEPSTHSKTIIRISCFQSRISRVSLSRNRTVCLSLFSLLSRYEIPRNIP